MQVVVASRTIPGWTHADLNPRLRISVDKPVVGSNNAMIRPGSAHQGTGYFQVVNCQVISGVLSIPQFTIDSLTDALVAPDAKYSGYFYSSTNQQIGPYPGFTSFTVPPVPATTWQALLIYNTTVVRVVDNRTYNRDQINALLAAAVGHIVNGHLLDAGAPVITPDSGAGIGAIIAIGGTDTRGVIDLVPTVTPPSGPRRIFHVTFGLPYSSAPSVVMYGRNAISSPILTHTYCDPTTTGFDFMLTDTALSVFAAYSWSYQVL